MSDYRKCCVCGDEHQTMIFVAAAAPVGAGKWYCQTHGPVIQSTPPDALREDERAEIRDAWMAARKANGQREAFVILERMVDRIGWQRTENNPPLAATPAPDVCKWTFDEWTDSWDTACGEKHQFMSDGPSENNHRHCPYCGRRLHGK